MLKRFKTLRRSTKVLIIALFLMTGVVVYAAISILLTQTFTSDLTKGDLFEMDLKQDEVTGEVTPGTSITVGPVIENKGTKDALAYIRVTVPGYGSSSTPAYSYEVDSDWVLVEDNGNEKVYGYSMVLGPQEETSVLTEELTMVNMDTSEFIGMGSVDFSFTGFLADCDVYGRNVEDGWGEIRDQE